MASCPGLPSGVPAHPPTASVQGWVWDFAATPRLVGASAPPSGVCTNGCRHRLVEPALAAYVIARVQSERIASSVLLSISVRLREGVVSCPISTATLCSVGAMLAPSGGERSPSPRGLQAQLAWPKAFISTGNSWPAACSARSRTRAGLAEVHRLTLTCQCANGARAPAFLRASMRSARHTP